MALREEVALDVSDALARIAQIERALTGAAQGFQRVLNDALGGVSGVEIAVTADTASLTRQVDQALDQSAVVPVAADTSAIPPEIDAAVPAEVDLPVSADFTGFDQALSQFQSTLPARVDGQALADQMFGPALAGLDRLRTEVDTTDVAIDVDTSSVVAGLDQAGRSADVFGDQIAEAEDDVGRLVDRLKLLAGVAAAAIAVQTVRVGVEYNTLVQRASAAFETLLGSAEASRDMLAEITEFASTSPFPRQVFIEATQQLLAFGFAAEEVVPSLDAIQQAIAASGGSTDDLREIVRVFAQIRSTGRITAEDLNQLGLRGINAAELIGEAFGQTAGEIRTAITRGTLDADDAIAALTEQMAVRFEGATERVRTTFVGTVDRIRASIRDLSSLLLSGFIDPEGGGAAVTIGNQLADEINGLREAAVPLVDYFNGQVLPVLAELTGELLPLIFSVIEAGLPIMGTFAASTGALAVVLRVVAQVLGALPPELISIVATAYTFTRVIGLVNAGLAVLRTRIQQTGVALAASNPLLLAFTVAATGIAYIMGQGSAATSEFEQAVSSLQRTLQSTEPTMRVFVDTLNDIAIDDEGFAAALNLIGLTTDGLIEAARAGTDFEQSVVSALSAMDPLGQLAGNDLLVGLITDQLKERIELLEETAEAEIAAGVARGEWTRGEVEAARAATFRTGSTVNQVDALELLRDAEIEAAAAQEEAVRAGAAAAAQLVERTRLIREMAGQYPQLAAGIAAVSNATTRTDRDLLGFALAADDAALSADQLEAVAAQLGISVDALRGLIQGATGALDEFTSAASSRLPTTGGIFRDLSQVADDTRGVPATMDRATRSTERFTRSLIEAREALEEALRPATEVDLEGAEIGIERAQLAQQRAVERVAEAEAALARVRFEAADEGVDAAQLRAQRERELREAHLAVREAELGQIEAAERLAEVRAQGTEADERVVEARERVADAERDLADAQRDAAESAAQSAARGRGAAETQIVTARMFTDALIAEAGRLRSFREDLATLTDAGFAEVAATIAREGPEIGAALADELANALDAGNTEIVQGLNDAINLFETEWSLTTEYFRDRLGPEFVLQAGIIGANASAAFGDDLDFAQRIRIAAELAESEMDLQGQSIATIAAQAGEQAARDYARLLDLEGPTVDAAIAAGLALRDDVIATDAGEAGKRVGQKWSEGVSAGIDEGVRQIEEAVVRAAGAAVTAGQRALKIKSPSQVAAELIGLPFAEGVAEGIGSGGRDVDAAVTAMTDAMVALGSDVNAQMRTGVSSSSTAAPAAAGPAGAGPLVGELTIIASDPEEGLRAAFTDLAAIQRRTR